MSDKIYNVLILCTGNSARSIMAECILDRLAPGRFVAHSAGSHPKGAIHPRTLELLHRFNYRTETLRSKDWSEFAARGAPPLDFVFTVCDSAAGEVCPVWPGQPTTAHWGFPDPAEASGSEEKIRAVFHDVYRQIEKRLMIFVNLPIESLDRLTLKHRLAGLGNAPSKSA